MKQLWAPWRLAFIEKADQKGECIFCCKPALRQDGRSYILYRSRHAFVMMNIYPYNNGHLLIAPYRHIARIEDLPLPVLTDVLRLVQRAVTAIRHAYAPEGFNIGINQGRAAGAVIEDHLHVHIVPRWHADTNFMPLLAETRVLPQHLKASFTRLKAALSNTQNSDGRRPTHRTLSALPPRRRRTRKLS